MASTSAQVGAAPAAPPAAEPNQDMNDLQSTFSNLQLSPLALKELDLIRLAGAIRDKPHWTTKIQDPEILARWRSELLSGEGVDPAAVDYVLAEQQYLAARHPGDMYPAAARGVWAADGWVAADLRQALLDGVAALEQGEPDWHPDSNEQVRDLLHPSLYPLVYDVTHAIAPLDGRGLTLDTCLAAMGGGAPITQLPAHIPANYRDHDVSSKYQWLPAEFDVAANGQVTILSCINNLHPQKHRALYPPLAAIFQRFVPLFESVLADYAHPPPPVISLDYNWYEDQPEPDYRDFPDDYAAYEEAYDQYLENRVPTPPTIPQCQPPETPRPGLSLKGRRLQVIVKIASIHLTPAKPEYPGGVWHLEGMRNENIIASGIYYFDQSNIQESSISFRQGVDEVELVYEQNDREGVEAQYGLEDEGEACQVVGRVSTPAGRCLCFPNNLQHRVAGFGLEEPSRPGHRKILVFWLVHPATHIMSTERVPPQQLDWLREEVGSCNTFWPAALPADVQKLVHEQVERVSTCPYSLAKAHEYRRALMGERKFYVGHQNEEAFERTISLCEH